MELTKKQARRLNHRKYRTRCAGHPLTNPPVNSQGVLDELADAGGSDTASSLNCPDRRLDGPGHVDDSGPPQVSQGHRANHPREIQSPPE